jgi:hypothetical protein
MPAKRPTSIQFYDEIEPLKDELSAVFGLKNLISAGVLLFSRLDSDTQKKLIKEITGLSTEPLQVYAESRLRQIIREELDSRRKAKKRIVMSQMPRRRI